MTKSELQNLVIDYADAYSIDRGIALAQIQRESGFNSGAIGSSGERGIAQIMPGTWARFGQGSFDNAFDPGYALTAWGAYMQWLLDRYGWDYSKTLMAYNGGEGHVDNGTVSSAARNYAASILASAGQSGDLSPSVDLADDSGNTFFGLPLAVALAVVLGLVFVLRE
jgi:soluble lytic murein transglycosylase-like protein